MLGLRAPAVRALAMRLRAVRLRVRFASQSARLHRAVIVHVADITSLEDPGDLTRRPLPLLSHIGLLLLAHMHVPAMLY